MYSALVLVMFDPEWKPSFLTSYRSFDLTLVTRYGPKKFSASLLPFTNWVRLIATRSLTPYSCAAFRFLLKVRWFSAWTFMICSFAFARSSSLSCSNCSNILQTCVEMDGFKLTKKDFLSQLFGGWFWSRIFGYKCSEAIIPNLNLINCLLKISFNFILPVKTPSQFESTVILMIICSKLIQFMRVMKSRYLNRHVWLK